MNKIPTKYVLKVWKSKKDYNSGNCKLLPFSEDDINNVTVLHFLFGKVLSRKIYGFEIYLKRTGRTIYYTSKTI